MKQDGQVNRPKPDPGKVNCVHCRLLNVDGCLECRRCALNCGCRCQDCASCRTKHHQKYFCKICHKCKRLNEAMPSYVCSCRTAPSYIPTSQWDTAFRANPLRRHLGLEIECSYIGKASGLEVPRWLKHQWTHDGSITSGGQELVLHPLAGDDFILGMDLVATELAKYGYKVDASCGFHAHVEAADFNAWSLRRLILLYHHFEDLFYGLVADGRAEGREVRGEMKYYAKRWDPPSQWFEKLARLKDSHDIRMEILRWLYGKRSAMHALSNGRNEGTTPGKYNPWNDMPSIREHKYEKARYYGLNIHTWFQRRTVEFRHHEGTIDPEKLIYWPLFCGWFVEIASALKDAEVAELQTVKQLVDGKWERLYKTVAIPPKVGEWVMRVLKERGRI